MAGRKWGIGLIVILVGLGMGASALAAKKSGMSKKEQKNFQEGNRLLRENKYYEAAEAFAKAGTEGQTGLNNIKSNFGDIYEAQKNVAQSPQSFEAALALAKLYHRRWQGFAEGKNPLADPFLNLAVAEYERAGQLNSQSQEPWQGRGDLYFQVQNWDQAIADYQKVLSVEGNNAAISLKLAQAYFEKGSLGEAENQAKAAWQADPKSGESAQLLGQIEEKKGNLDGAHKYYQAALQRNPRLKLAKIKVNEIMDAKAPKGYIKVALITEAESAEMWGLSDVDSQSQAGVSVGAYSSSSSGSYNQSGSASASGSYDTTKYGSGSAEASGEYSESGSAESSGSGSAMSGTMYSQRYACRPDDTQVIAYNIETKRQYPLEDGVRTPLPSGSYVLYASFHSQCTKQFGDDYVSKTKTEWKKAFTLPTGQYYNLEMLMKAGMTEKECFIEVRAAKEKFQVD